MKEIILFQSGAYCENQCPDDYSIEEDIFNSVMQSVKAIFEPSIFVRTIGRWNDTFNGYKYCHNFKDLQDTVSDYDDIIVRQIGTRLHFTLIHHDGRHKMELRHLSDYGYNNRDNVCRNRKHERRIYAIYLKYLLQSHPTTAI